MNKNQSVFEEQLATAKGPDIPSGDGFLAMV
jgi:hypothetical protein